MRAMQSACRANFNHYSHGNVSFITEGHKDVFTALTAGMPNFCLTSIYVNGRPAVAVVLVDREGDRITMAPCFVSITPGMKLRSLDGDEYEMAA
ncbi:hypothetical protein ACRC7T_17460 (plasmid) [Segnochrobactraceae bacterium EtOH-i3]